MEKNDMVYQGIQKNYGDAELLISTLYDRYMKNPEDEEMKMILLQTLEMAKGITRTQEAMLELYPEEVKKANLSNAEDRRNALDDSISTLMNGRTK